MQLQQNNLLLFQISNASYSVSVSADALCEHDAYCSSRLNVSMHLLISLAKKSHTVFLKMN